MDVTETLQQLGFSEKEALTYQAVLELGRATAGEVAEQTPISKGYVYDIVQRLADRGVVSVNDTVTPAQVRPLPPAEGVDALEVELDELREHLEGLYTECDPQVPEIDLIKSRQTAYRYVEKLIRSAERELYLTLPRGAFRKVQALLGDAHERGVFVRLLVSDELDESQVDALSACAAVARSWAQTEMPFAMVCDHRSAVFSDRSLLVGEHRDGDYGVICENSPKLTGGVLSSMSNFWVTGREVHVTAPDALPATYQSFRNAVVHSALHRDRGTALGVDALVHEVAGRTGDDVPTRIEGRLVEVRQSILDPWTSDFPLENSLYVERDAETVSLGGEGAFVEDYETTEVTLFAAG